MWLNIEKSEGVGSGRGCALPSCGLGGLTLEKNCAKNYAILSKFGDLSPCPPPAPTPMCCRRKCMPYRTGNIVEIAVPELCCSWRLSLHSGISLNVRRFSGVVRRSLIAAIQQIQCSHYPSGEYRVVFYH